MPDLRKIRIVERMVSNNCDHFQLMIAFWTDKRSAVALLAPPTLVYPCTSDRPDVSGQAGWVDRGSLL